MKGEKAQTNDQRYIWNPSPILIQAVKDVAGLLFFLSNPFEIGYLTRENVKSKIFFARHCTFVEYNSRRKAQI